MAHAEPSCRLAEIRRAHGIRRVEIAAASGVSIGLIGELERGRIVSVGVGRLVRIAWALGVPVADVWPALAADPPRPGLVQRAQGIAAERAELVRELVEKRRPVRKR